MTGGSCQDWIVCLRPRGRCVTGNNKGIQLLRVNVAGKPPQQLQGHRGIAVRTAALQLVLEEFEEHNFCSDYGIFFNRTTLLTHSQPAVHGHNAANVYTPRIPSRAPQVMTLQLAALAVDQPCSFINGHHGADGTQFP